MDCQKRQSEVYKGTPQLRCINPQSTNHKQLVVLEQCAGCPVRVLLRNQDTRKVDPETRQILPVLNQQEGYPPCPFRFAGREGLTCSITNLPVNEEICGRCEADTREHEATAGEKVTNYFGALRRWAAHGCPTRTMEEREQLFNNNCKGCDRFDPEAHACKNCGCKVSAGGTPLTNKLAMATEHCPLGRF